MIFDFHNDVLWENLSQDDKHSYLAAHKDVSIVAALWTTDKMFDIASKIKQTVTEFSCHKNVLFAIEDLHFVTPYNIDIISSLPLVYCTLSWKHDNTVAGGHKGDNGVTKFGKTVIKSLCKNKIAIDTAHLNERSFYDTLECAEFVLNSHTCQSEIYPHTRNLSDTQIKRLIEHGGIVSLTPVEMFMSKTCACRNDFLFQIIRFADKFGIENLAVGSDFFGAPPLKGLNSYEHFLFLKDELNSNGMTQNQINRIFFDNAQNFCKRIKNS